jgi:malonyl-CoA O-methyltransferase
MSLANRQRQSGSIARRFGRHAQHYERNALLQREAAETLASLIAPEGHLPGEGPVVEIGCGTGLFTSLVAQKNRPYLATDIAPEMVAACRARFATAASMDFTVMDGQAMHFTRPPEWIVSNLVFQWFTDPARTISELACQTETLAFSVLVHGSFPEWHSAFADIGRRSGLFPLPEASPLLAALPSTMAVRHEVRTHTLRYENAAAFVHSFRGIGADQPRPGYRPTPIRPILQRFAQGMTATAKVLYCVAEHKKGDQET